MKKKEWQAKNVVSTALAHKLITEQCTSLNIKTIEYLDAGWDNTVFLVNNEYAFRFPRREIAVTLLKNEGVILSFIANKLPLPIPEILFSGLPSKDYPYPFAGYQFLTGTAASSARLTRQQRINNTIILANFLKTLHSTKLQKNLTIKHQSTKRIDLALLIPKIQDNLKQLDKLELAPTEKLQRYVNQLPLTLHDDTFCLVHGDFYPKHILVSECQLACGIIDWGDAELNNPALDLAIVFQFIPKEAHDLFRTNYHMPISATTWELARLRALYSASVLAAYAQDINDRILFDDSIVSLGLIAETLD